jgi:hypothetical protein
MSPQRAGRTQPCDRRDALTRLEHARAFLDVAELVGTDRDELATPSVSTALAVLAAIAASDAVCCAMLRQRSRGQDHQQAVDLLRSISPGGPEMARDLSRLLAIKDDAHYGLLDISTQRATSALRQARRLLAAVERLVR